MIGVAFALRDTFGTSNDIVETALARLLREYVRARRLPPELCDDADRKVVAPMPIDSVDALRATLVAVLGPHHVPADDRKFESRIRMEAARLVATRFVPYPDVDATLTDLARLGIPLAALGDGWPSVDQRKADAVGFTGTIVHRSDFPDDPGAHPAFDEIARRLHLPIENVWFVGTDLAREIEPATAAGMHTIWIDRSGMELGKFRRVRARFDKRVTSFSEIREALGEPYTRGLLALHYILRTSLNWRPGHTVRIADTFDSDDES